MSRAGLALSLVGLLATGCSHAWEVLEPLPGSTGTGGGTGASGAGGEGFASSTATTSSGGGAGGAMSSAQSTSAASSSAASSSAASSSAASSSSSGGGGSTVGYAAVLAACNSDQDLSIDKCEAAHGVGTMDVDGTTDALTTNVGFVRFDLDGALAGKTIDSVTLRLTTASVVESDSNMSGEIWSVEKFDKVSLAIAQPQPVGVDPVAPDLGPVVISHDYVWPLPKALVGPNGSVFLAVYSPSSDGVRYWNDHGDVPPMLYIDYH